MSPENQKRPPELKNRVAEAASWREIDTLGVLVLYLERALNARVRGGLLSKRALLIVGFWEVEH